MASDTGIFKPTLTLLAGGALAQALPLLLAPLLTRLYTPDQFGHYTLIAAVAVNVGVIACARYEYALPLEADAQRARALLALCLRVLLAVSLLCVPVAIWLSLGNPASGWLWLPAVVASAGAVQCLTMWATRAQRFGALSLARVVHVYGGLAVLAGLIGPVVAARPAVAIPLALAALLGWVDDASDLSIRLRFPTEVAIAVLIPITVSVRGPLYPVAIVVGVALVNAVHLLLEQSRLFFLVVVQYQMPAHELMFQLPGQSIHYQRFQVDQHLKFYWR